MRALRVTFHGIASSTDQDVSDVTRIIERAGDVDRGFQPGDFPLVDRRTAVAIRLFQEQVPLGVEGVDLDLIIFVVVAVGVDEDLEVVVMKDDRIMLRQRGPDVRFLEQGADVEICIVPEHPGAGLEPRGRAGFSQDVDEGIGPGGPSPGFIVQAAVDLNRGRRLIADVAFGRT